ncbi:EthD family reductase [Pseudonocardia sp. H11422]|uniref:EthD family reductase n=1 Tax=Pseudonocardia sp. H11422 TaxID=2835866 RepID=UPI00202832F0|nr:EthD family reductase [Pseudonocardia sp. H11422]
MGGESADTVVRRPPDLLEAPVSYQLTVIYNQPEDTAAFDKHYDEVHAPLATKIPGLQSFTISRPGPGPDGSPPPYHLVAVLTFESEEAFGAGMGSAEGQAAVDDLPNFAGAGVTILNGPSRTVA